jgi:hypothetical protein
MSSYCNHNHKHTQHTNKCRKGHKSRARKNQRNQRNRRYQPNPEKRRWVQAGLLSYIKGSNGRWNVKLNDGTTIVQLGLHKAMNSLNKSWGDSYFALSLKSLDTKDVDDVMKMKKMVDSEYDNFRRIGIIVVNDNDSTTIVKPDGTGLVMSSSVCKIDIVRKCRELWGSYQVAEYCEEIYDKFDGDYKSQIVETEKLLEKYRKQGIVTTPLLHPTVEIIDSYGNFHRCLNPYSISTLEFLEKTWPLTEVQEVQNEIEATEDTPDKDNTPDNTPDEFSEWSTISDHDSEEECKAEEERKINEALVKNFEEQFAYYEKIRTSFKTYHFQDDHGDWINYDRISDKYAHMPEDHSEGLFMECPSKEEITDYLSSSKVGKNLMIKFDILRKGTNAKHSDKCTLFIAHSCYVPLKMFSKRYIDDTISQIAPGDGIALKNATLDYFRKFTDLPDTNITKTFALLEHVTKANVLNMYVEGGDEENMCRGGVAIDFHFLWRYKPNAIISSAGIVEIHTKLY